MGFGRGTAAVSVTALFALGAVLSPVLAASTRTGPAKPRVSLAERGGIGTFTPAATDARLAAALARAGLSSTGFRFTPASSVRLNRSVTIAVRARTSGPAGAANERTALVAPAMTGLSPIAYNLGVAVGWRRFAVSGDVAKVDIGTIGRREALDVGVSYNASKWSTRLQVGADRAISAAPRAIVGSSGYSVDVGGSYALTRNLDLTAGVRYRMQRDRLLARDDERRDSQAVYVGTAIHF